MVAAERDDRRSRPACRARALSACRRSTAWMRATSSRGLNGFGEVVVGAHLEPDDAVDVLALRGQHDDRHVLARAAQPPADGEAVLAGQHQVEHDEVRRVALQPLVEVARVGDRAHVEPLAGQVARQQVAQPHVVVDDEDAHRGRRRFRVHRVIGTRRGVGDRRRGVTDCNGRARVQRPVACAASRGRTARRTLGSNALNAAKAHSPTAS